MNGTGAVRTPTTVLITGCNGFVGSHLAEECLKRGWRVHGTVRHHRSPLDLIETIASSLVLHRCDVTDAASVYHVIAAVKPGMIFHLAAQSYVPDSWLAPWQSMEANLLGTLNVLEAVRRHSPGSAVQVCSSSEAYGLVHPGETPIRETSPLRPLSPYGVSKAACDMLGRQYAASYGLRVVVTRAFNHEGPRRGAHFAPSDWCKQVAEIEAKTRPATIYHGNLSAVRDITDVRDICGGYIAALMRGHAGEVYQLCSGRGQTMREVLDMIIAMSDRTISTAVDPTRMRPSDVPLLLGDPSKAEEELGWTARIPLETTVRDCLNWWRRRMSVGETRRRRAPVG